MGNYCFPELNFKELKIMNYTDNICDRLKEFRRKLYLKQVEVVRKLDVSQAFYSQFECNNRPVPDRIITDICKIFSVNEDWLRFGTGKMFVGNLNENMELTSEERDFIYSLRSLPAENKKLLKNLLNCVSAIQDNATKEILNSISKIAKT